MDSLETVAPVFVDMAHQIVWATAATVSTAGGPSTRILHPIWEWDGAKLRGWIATSPSSLKARHLARNPMMSLNYWRPNHDTCSAMCRTSWNNSPAARQALWDRFSEAPAPVGYKPSIVPGWDTSMAAGFGVLELQPVALRVMEGSRMASGDGALLQWREA